MNRAPKILIQTSKKRLPGYVVKKLYAKIPSDWEYRHFVDEEVIDFFKEYPVDEFPDVVERYQSISVGATRSDLFRYYFLYVKGGVYIDSDVMLKKNILDIIRNYSFVTVLGTMFKGTVFNGFLYSTPGNPIIHQALREIYSCDLNNLNTDYFYSCSFLFKLLTEKNYDFPVGLYREDYYTDRCLKIIDENKETLFYHYWIGKIIPRSSSLYFLKYFLRKELWILLRYHIRRLFLICKDES